MWWFIVKQPSLECSVVHKVVSRSVEMHNLPNLVRNLFSCFIKSAQLYDAQIPAFGGTATVSGSKISEEGGPSEGLGTEVTQWVKARSPRRESWRKVLQKSSNYTTHVRRRTVIESKTSLRYTEICSLPREGRRCNGPNTTNFLIRLRPHDA